MCSCNKSLKGILRITINEGHERKPLKDFVCIILVILCTPWLLFKNEVTFPSICTVFLIQILSYKNYNSINPWFPWSQMQMLDIYCCHFMRHNMMVCGQVIQALGGHVGAYKGCYKPYWGFYSLCAIVTNPIRVFIFCYRVVTILGNVLQA